MSAPPAAASGNRPTPPARLLQLSSLRSLTIFPPSPMAAWPRSASERSRYSLEAPDVVLAGTGDPNDALESYYGSGLLRSADGGLTWSLISESERLRGELDHQFLLLRPGLRGFCLEHPDSQPGGCGGLAIRGGRHRRRQLGRHGRGERAQRHGTLLLDRCRTDMAARNHHRRSRPDRPDLDETHRRWWQRRNRRRLESRSQPFLRRCALSRLLRIPRRHDLDAARQPARQSALPLRSVRPIRAP